jgi:hypothetical protein
MTMSSLLWRERPFGLELFQQLRLQALAYLIGQIGPIDQIRADSTDHGMTVAFAIRAAWMAPSKGIHLKKRVPLVDRAKSIRSLHQAQPSVDHRREHFLLLGFALLQSLAICVDLAVLVSDLTELMGQIAEALTTPKAREKEEGTKQGQADDSETSGRFPGVTHVHLSCVFRRASGGPEPGSNNLPLSIWLASAPAARDQFFSAGSS